MNIQKNIAATLKNAMREKDMTLVEFADEIGIARSSLQVYLNEHSNPRADTIELLSEKLHIPPSKLISGPENLIDTTNPTGRDEIHPLLSLTFELCHEISLELLRISELLKQAEQEAESK